MPLLRILRMRPINCHYCYREFFVVVVVFGMQLVKFFAMTLLRVISEMNQKMSQELTPKICSATVFGQFRNRGTLLLDDKLLELTLKLAPYWDLL